MPQSSKHTQKLIEDEDILILQEPHMVGMEHQKVKRQGFKNVWCSSSRSKHTRQEVVLIAGRVMYEAISLRKWMEINLPSTLYIFPLTWSQLKIVHSIAAEEQGTLACVNGNE